MCFVLFSNLTSIPIIEKCVKVDVKGITSFAVKGKIIETAEHGIEAAKDIDSFMVNLKKFEDIQLCYGWYTIFGKGLLQQQQFHLITKNSSSSQCCKKCKPLYIYYCVEKKKGIRF